MKIVKPKFAITRSSLVNVAGGIGVIYLLVVLAGTVKNNYDLGNQIDNLQAQISLLQAQKNALAYSLQYYGTSSFQDRQARAKLGLQLPGENVVIIPHATPPTSPEQSEAAPVSPQPQSNFQRWLDFLAGHSS